MTVGAPEEDRALLFDGVQVLARGLEARGVHFVDDDPCGRRIGRDAGADGRGGLLDGELLVVQRAAAQRQRAFGDVDVAVDEAGKHGESAGVDHGGVRADVARNLLVAAHEDDLAARDGEGAGGGRCFVHRAHVTIAQDQVGGRLPRATGAEQEGDQGGEGFA